MLQSASDSSVVQSLVAVGDVWLGIGDVYLETLYLQDVEIQVVQPDIPLEMFYEELSLDIEF